MLGYICEWSAYFSLKFSSFELWYSAVHFPILSTSSTESFVFVIFNKHSHYLNERKTKANTESSISRLHTFREEPSIWLLSPFYCFMISGSDNFVFFQASRSPNSLSNLVSVLLHYTASAALYFFYTSRRFVASGFCSAVGFFLYLYCYLFCIVFCYSMW